MKKYILVLCFICLICGCVSRESSFEEIPVTIDPADLVATETSMDLFETRRNRVLDKMEAGFCLLESMDEANLNRHQFRPNNYFYYLTGIDMPHSMAVLAKETDHAFTLVLPPVTTRSLIYEGERMSAGEAEALYRPDGILEYHEQSSLLNEIFFSGKPVYMDMSSRTHLCDLVQKFGKEIMTHVEDVGLLLDEMRVIKDPAEVKLLQKACNITAKALVNAMRVCEPGRYEFEIESVIEGTFLQYGSAMPGFPSIVGSGPNSTILHYEPNTRKMENGDMLLMDIGAEYGYYTADITRTIPVSGTFSPEQRTIYQLVLAAQKAAIEELIPGNMIGDGHLAASGVITEGLVKLGLITDPDAPWQIGFYILYPSSHFLGMDVHDVGETGGFFSNYRLHPTGDTLKSRILEPGMVLTIEPGLYFREKGLDQLHEIFGDKADSSDIERFKAQVSPIYNRYLHIGVRIEDDILITENGNLVLSRYAPREIGEIEALMKSQPISCGVAPGR